MIQCFVLQYKNLQASIGAPWAQTHAYDSILYRFSYQTLRWERQWSYPSIVLKIQPALQSAFSLSLLPKLSPYDPSRNIRPPFHNYTYKELAMYKICRKLWRMRNWLTTSHIFRLGPPPSLWHSKEGRPLPSNFHRQQRPHSLSAQLLCHSLSHSV